MSALPEIDLTDPGYLRHCMRPDCTESFNIAEQAIGAVGISGPGAEGWHLIRMFSGVYLCPRHSRRVANGDHMPSWIWDCNHDQVLGTGCACEWSWRPGRPATNGEHQQRWAAHLTRVDP